ncbi:MAG TPA: tagatose 1,6-diphosphate aldolase [Verrucomicrobiae bacterium]|nr:tagatose 1,6-diphosphate aldolase [Verrucomicrobiae bacterium]
MNWTPGKLNGMKALADSRGVIAAAAMDQRGSLKKAIAKEKGVSADRITNEMMAEFKSAVTRILTPYASAILLDPEYGLPAMKQRAQGKGVLLAYEQSGYDNTRPGRIPDLLIDWTVRKLKEAGADAVKLLIYYTPFDDAKVNAEKHSFVERIGAECALYDIPYFLEFVGYDPKGGDEKSVEYARQKPEIVTESIAEFSKPEYKVDVLKVEIPVALEFVEGTRAFKGTKAYSKSEAMEHYKKAAKAAKKPFIYLSAGVSNAQFLESLELAAEAQIDFNGVLCGRATWKEGIPVYAKQGLKALEDWLADVGVKNIRALNERLKAAAPWFKKFGASSIDELEKHAEPAIIG